MTRQAPGLSIGSASDRVETRHCFPDFTRMQFFPGRTVFGVRGVQELCECVHHKLRRTMHDQMIVVVMSGLTVQVNDLLLVARSVLLRMES